jgi:DNA-binding transcriptional ArsR family regulator
MRVLDLAEPQAPLALEVVPSLAAELLVSVVAVGDALQATKDADSYDIGRRRLEALARALPADLATAVERITAGYGKLTANLLGLVYFTPPPRDIASFFARLESTDPLDLLLHLLGYHMAGHRRITPPDVIRRAAEGDADAAERLLSDSRKKAGDLAQAQAQLLSLDRRLLKASLVDFLDRWNQVVFSHLSEEARPVLERDAAIKRAVMESSPPEKIVELATNGIQFTRDPGIDRIMLFPTYVLRPWVLISECGDVKIFCYPVADESLEVPESVPPPQLVKLYKALGDANRLKLLKRLSAGPLTLKEATDLLKTAKSTAYHHLAILRQAGLVWMRESDDKTYTLRGDLIPQAGELLQSFLARPDTSESARVAPSDDRLRAGDGAPVGRAGD